MRYYRIGSTILTMAATLFFTSCGNGESQEEGVDETFVEEVEQELVNGGERVVYYGTPSLVEVASIMESSGAEFTPELLNDPSLSSNYNTNDIKALNLGVYGADLAYSAMFEHTQESINFLKTIKTMSEELGLTGAFEADLISSIETNITNRDSLLDVVTDFYWSADAYLQDNDRSNVAALIIAGGWLESMYLACNMSANSPNNKDIKKKISEQKLILKNLVLFLEDAGKGDGSVEAINTKMKELQGIYSRIEITHGDIETEVKDGEVIIENETEVKLDEEVLKELCGKISQIREEIVQ